MVNQYLKSVRTEGYPERLKEPFLTEALSRTEGNRKLYPFDIGAVRVMLELWRQHSKRTIRAFKEDFCAKALEYGVEEEVPSMGKEETLKAIHHHFNLWRNLLSEWWERSDKHTIAQYALFHALNFLKGTDLKSKGFRNIGDIVPSVRVHTKDWTTLLADILVVSEEGKQMIVEVERSAPQRLRYEKIADVMTGEDAEYSGALVLALTIDAYLQANKLLLSLVRNPKKYHVIRVKTDGTDELVSVLGLGRLLMCVSLDERYEFPSDEKMRAMARRYVDRDIAESGLKYLGVLDAINKMLS